MSLEKRASKLEASTDGNAGGSCLCPGEPVVVWFYPESADDEPPTPRPCKRCGRPIRVIVLRWPEET